MTFQEEVDEVFRIVAKANGKNWKDLIYQAWYDGGYWRLKGVDRMQHALLQSARNSREYGHEYLGEFKL